MRIDSIKTYSDSIIYFPFHTARGSWFSGLGGAWFPSPDSSGGSWLGKRVIKLNDGTFLFDNLRGDTVVIKSLANVGDSWIFCRDTSTTYYSATVTSLDTMTILGISDSVKRILIRAYNSTGLLRTDVVDSFQIVLSKNYGFAEIFDLYTFPYHKPDSAYIPHWDYYLDHSLFTSGFFMSVAPDTNNSIFRRVNFINPPTNEMFDASNGDIFGSLHYYYTFTLRPPNYILDTVVSKSVSGHNTTYAFSGIEILYDYLTASYSYIHHSAGKVTYDNILLFDTSKMPEEVASDLCNYYFPNDTSYCVVSPLYKTGWVYYEDGKTYTYKKGLGLVDYVSSTGDPSYWEDRLVYYNKAGVVCGQFPLINTAVLNVTGNSIAIYPNPASSILTIKYSETINSVEVTNVFGKTIYTQECNTNIIQIDITSLPSGLYFIKINGTEVRKVLKQ